MVSLSCSLIISTYNWPQALEIALQSVMCQRILPDEIVIADDGSGERTRELIQRFTQSVNIPVKHVWHEDKGFRLAEIRNKAIAAAQYDYIIQVDGDVILHPYFIADHLYHSRPNRYLKGTRANLGPELSAEVLTGSVPPSSLHAGTKGILNAMNARRSRLISVLLRADRLSYFNVKGCNMSFWKSDLYRVNGYNSAITGWGHEDVDLAKRLTRAGVKQRTLKLCAIVFHIYHNELPRDRCDETYRRFIHEAERQPVYAVQGIRGAAEI